MLKIILILFTILNLNTLSLFCDSNVSETILSCPQKIKLHIPRDYKIEKFLVPSRGPDILVSSCDEAPELNLEENTPFGPNETFRELITALPYNTPIAFAITKYLDREGQSKYRMWDHPSILNNYIFGINPTDSISPESLHFRIKKDPFGNLCVGPIHYVVLTVKPNGAVSQKYLGTDRDAFAVTENLQTKTLINLVLPNLSDPDFANPEILDRIANHYKNGEGTLQDSDESNRYLAFASRLKKEMPYTVRMERQLRKCASSLQSLFIRENTLTEHPQKINITPEPHETINAHILRQNELDFPATIAIITRDNGTVETHYAPTLNKQLFPKSIFLEKEIFGTVILDPTITDVRYLTNLYGKKTYLCSIDDLFVSEKHPQKFLLRAQTCPQVYEDAELLYAYGNICKENKEEEQAFKLYEMSSQAGNPKATNALAVFYINGIHVPKDYKTAIQLLRKASDEGNTQATKNLNITLKLIVALKLLKGENTEQNILGAAELVNSYCMDEDNAPLKNLLLNEIVELSKKYKATSEEFIKCLEASLLINPENTSANYKLGKSLLANKKYTEAARHFEKSINHKGTIAAIYYFVCLLKSFNPNDELWENARSHLKDYEGDPGTAACLGIMYINGWGGEKNETNGNALIKFAIESNDNSAQIVLGNYFVERDLSTALNCYNKSYRISGDYQGAILLKKYLQTLEISLIESALKCLADEGDTDSQSYLAYAYYVRNMYGKAYEYAKPAADNGNVTAQNIMGRLLFDGHGIKKNEELGIEYIEKSAQQNYPPALFGLSEIRRINGQEEEAERLLNEAKKYF